MIGGCEEEKGRGKEGEIRRRRRWRGRRVFKGEEQKQEYRTHTQNREQNTQRTERRENGVASGENKQWKGVQGEGHEPRRFR